MSNQVGKAGLLILAQNLFFGLVWGSNYDGYVKIEIYFAWEMKAHSHLSPFPPPPPTWKRG